MERITKARALARDLAMGWEGPHIILDMRLRARNDPGHDYTYIDIDDQVLETFKEQVGSAFKYLVAATMNSKRVVDE